MNERIEVLFIPYAKRNPYQNLLIKSLSLHNIHVELFQNIDINKFQNIGNDNKKIIHFHWPSVCYKKNHFVLLRSFNFCQKINKLKNQGFKIIWTCHNLLPHDERWRFIDIKIRKFLLKSCDGIIFHCQCAKNDFFNLFGIPNKYKVIPHGSYMEYYEPIKDKKKSREQISIPQDKCVLLAFGRHKAYKGLDKLLQTFDSLSTTNPAVFLLIAGKGDPIVQGKVDKYCSAATKMNLKLDLEFVPDNQLPLYFGAADILVSSHENVTTSGSIILGLSYGLPVVAPATGCIPELIHERAGVLYDPSSSGSLKAALENIISSDYSGMGKHALEIAKKLSWNDIGQQTADFYREVCIC